MSERQGRQSTAPDSKTMLTLTRAVATLCDAGRRSATYLGYALTAHQP